MSRPSRRLALQAKSNRAPSIKAPEPACAGRMCLQHSPGMVGTLAREQRLRGTRIVRLQQRTNGTTLRASRSDGEGRRFGKLHHRSPIRRLHRARLRWVLVQRQVRHRPVIVVYVVPYNSPQVRFAKYDDMIEAIPAKGPEARKVDRFNVAGILANDSLSATVLHLDWSGCGKMRKQWRVRVCSG